MFDERTKQPVEGSSNSGSKNKETLLNIYYVLDVSLNATLVSTGFILPTTHWGKYYWYPYFTGEDQGMPK